MDVKESLIYKLLYHFQRDPEWMEFFNALLDSCDWSIFDLTHYEDSDVGQKKIYNGTDELHAATSTGFGTLVDGGEADSSFSNPSLEGGTATTPSDSLEVQDSWSSILQMEIDFSVGRRYSIIESSPANSANFYYQGVRSQSIVYQGGPVYMERWDLNWVTIAVEGIEGFCFDYKNNDFPLLFSPGSFFDLRYAYSLYKKTLQVRYEKSPEKLVTYTDHWLHSPVFLDLQTIYIPNLRYCFPEISTFTDKIYKGTVGSVGSPTNPPYIYVEDLETDLIGEVYSYSHGIVTLKEPCSNFNLAALQAMQDKIIYRREYQYQISFGMGVGYIPTELPDSLRAYIQESRRFLSKFTKESVPARIDIPIIFSS